MTNKLDIPTIPNIEETVKKIKSGELKSFDLVKIHLERAKEINPLINSFITILDDESVLTKAKEIDEKIANGEQVGKLAGIPFTVKDLYLVEGTRTTFSSKLMEDFIAPYTATVVQKCLDEGAILIAKCNSDPWGNGGSGENSGYGPTKNPYDFTRTPGGSSSGSAASLASGVGFFSLGTDTGGSSRLPATYCGVYGFKPTYGRNSRFGIGAMASSFDTPGFFARHLEDVALLEEIMAGKDSNDATTYEIPVEIQNSEPLHKPVRIGIPKEYFEEGLDSTIKEKIDGVIKKYKDAGAEIVDVSIPSTEYGLAVYYILVPSEISSNRARYDGVRYGKKVSDNYQDNMVGSRSEFLEDEVKRRIMIGTYSLSAGYADQFYKQASKVRTKLAHEFNEIFKKVDCIIAPVSPCPPFKLGEKSDDPLQMYLVDVYTVTANIVGIPALAIPAGLDDNNLPVGFQLMAPKFKEDVLIKAAGLI
jgi:aspartyl-tRNA(Asn)/glutamyl-tRNA(Gln) amidotransferase subunit A